MRPTFADPKADLVFKRIFGQEAHKHLLIALIEDLLGLEGDRRLRNLEYLPPEQVPVIDGLKDSIVDVRCVDHRGTRYVVEMQVLHVEGFEKRVVYNLCKSYTSQLLAADNYPSLDEVVAVTVCDFKLWGERRADGDYEVPMLSRWRMTEERTGAHRLGQLRCVFLELPKYTAGDRPVSTIDRWAYFFRETRHLRAVPAPLAEAPWRDALEVARTHAFTLAEWDAYDRMMMAVQDARGAITLAAREGREEGRELGREEGREEGRELGREEGRELGREEGRELGRREGLQLGRREGLQLGREEGRREGAALGRQEGAEAARLDERRARVRDLAEALGLAVDDGRARWLAALDLAGLDDALAHLKRERRWPA